MWPLLYGRWENRPIRTLPRAHLRCLERSTIYLIKKVEIKPLDQTLIEATQSETNHISDSLTLMTEYLSRLERLVYIVCSFSFPKMSD